MLYVEEFVGKTTLRAVDRNPPEVQGNSADIEFLVDRATETGSVSFGVDPGRWTGMSSNALVAVAFGRKGARLPSDSDDLTSCYRCMLRMPERRRDAAMPLLRRGEAAVRGRWGDEAVLRARKWAGWPTGGTENERG